ncbi:MAG TPA: orotidine-5'-phosphate decarboxylase [bacterium]|nr:orotidine-5'-phosphate decarboxylase [bacterium]
MAGSATRPHPPAAHERLIFALDVANLPEALDWVSRLRGQVRVFKVGLELFLAGGWDAVHQIARAGGPVFLDLKLLDIPATVRSALRQISSHADALRMVTVHAASAVSLAEAGLDARLQVLAVPVLTSVSSADLHALGVRQDLALPDYVLLLARRAMGLGCHGVITSPHEARVVRQALGPACLIVTPGVRPTWAVLPGDDQQRAATPAQAIAAGADHLVVGRPIRDAADPVDAARRIQEEIAQALEGCR